MLLCLVYGFLFVVRGFMVADWRSLFVVCCVAFGVWPMLRLVCCSLCLFVCCVTFVVGWWLCVVWGFVG